MMSIESNEVARGHEHGQGHHHGHEHGHEHEDKESQVRVIYNGVTEKIRFEFFETLGVLRERATKAFGNVPTPHLLSLYTSAGTEFGPDRDQQTIRDAGIKKNDELLLRPGVVRGG
jgi:hypothetical protein